MFRFSPLAVGLALPLSLISQVALADLTPQQVWSDWRAYIEGMGYQLTANESANGGNLTVSDINMSFALPDGDALQMSMGNLRFDQNNDGSVAIIMPDVMPIQLSGNGQPGGEPFSTLLNYSQTGHSIIASGTPDKTTYDYAAQSAVLTLENVEVDGQKLPANNAALNVTINNIDTTTTMAIGTARQYDQTGSVDSITYDFAASDPENPTAGGEFNGTLKGLNFNGGGTIPLSILDAADMSAMLAAGFDAAGTFSYTEGSANFDIRNPKSESFAMTTSSQGGELGFEMGSGGLTYSGAQRDVNVSVTPSVMPFQFQVAMAESGFNLSMPVSVSGQPEDFAFGITMGDFTMSDIIWGMFDPAGQLPRDPATIILDLAGKAKLLVDWMNPEAASQLIGPPAELGALTLNNLIIDAVGAKLEGNGAFTFDGPGPQMVPNIGNPVGALNVALAGGNGLMDKLVALGLLPQEQAMGARMMMGLFAVPGDTPDTLNSKIEFTSEGQILANGQRIR
ncbi:MAG: hypothetical protein ABJL67_19625 [Sulfitobacter sp.]